MHRSIPALLATIAFIPAQAFAEEAAGEASTEIVVFGQGQTRQSQEIKPADIAILPPGSSPFRAIEKLPSVNFQSADPFGNYEWSTRITIRGFSQNQLGFNLDGIPLGDMTYGNHNGLHISRAISSDNIGSTIVSQGSGSINTQSTNNLGGTIQFYSMDPAEALGVDANLTYGSENTMRGFARVGVGSAEGARAFLSAHYHKADKWKGEGEQRTWMINAKAVVPLGIADLDAYLSYSDRAEQDYQDLSLGMIDRLGYDWDNFYSNYALAVRVADIGANRGETTTPLNPAAGTVYPAPITNADDAYYDASGLRKDLLGAVGLTVPLGEKSQLLVRGYYHHNDGQGTWGTPYVNSPTGVPMSVRTTEYEIERTGVFASLDTEFSFNKLTLGLWYEHNNFTQARRFYAYASRTDPGRDHLEFMTTPFRTDWEINFTTNTFQYHVHDEIALGDLKLSLGWKGFKVDNRATPKVLGGRTTGELKVEDWFQPHAGLNYKFGNGLEAFAGFTQVTRAYPSSVTSGPFSSSQAGFDGIKPVLKPEQSDTYELGLRYNSGRFAGVLAGYYVNFRNRLLTIPTSVGIVGSVNALQNVGEVRAAGIEASGTFKLDGGWSLFASYSYNDNTYRNDVVIRTLDTAGNPVVTTIPTAGKKVVDSPEHILHGEVAYDVDRLFGRIGASYMSKRFFNYLNDRSVEGRTLVDAAIGYRFDIGMRKPIELQLNVTNLFDERYVSTIGSNGFGNSGDNQTLLAGAPRQFFATLKAGF